MKLNFRQGIVKAPTRYLFLDGNEISIDCSEGTVTATAAHYDANYLIDERSSVGAAWGPLSWNLSWGPEPTDPTYHLYWDIKVGSGEVTRGFTPHSLQYGPVAPVDPYIDQHWFDTSSSLMKVWTSDNIWKLVIRVFAGNVNNTQIVHSLAASQIEDISICDAGYIVYDMLKRGITTPNKTFLTSSNQLAVDHGSFSSPIRLELLNISAAANEPIPAFNCVASLKNGFVGLATTDNEELRPFAITLTEAVPGQSVDLISVGMIYNDQWDWDPSKPADLYCDAEGLITQDKPAGLSYRVGTVVSPTIIYADIERYNSFTHIGDITYVVGGGGGGSGPTGPRGATGPTGAASTVAGPTGPASTVAGPTGPASTVAGPTGPAGDVTNIVGPAWTAEPEAGIDFGTIDAVAFDGLARMNGGAIISNTSLVEFVVPVTLETVTVTDASLFHKTVASPITLVFDGVFDSTELHSFTLEITNSGGARLITWPLSVKWPDGAMPTSTAGVDVYTFYTRDNGTTWRGCLAASYIS